MSDNTDNGSGGGNEQTVPLSRFQQKLKIIEDKDREIGAYETKVQELEGQVRKAAASSLAQESLRGDYKKMEREIEDMRKALEEKDAAHGQELALAKLHVTGDDDDIADIQEMIKARYRRLGDDAPDFSKYVSGLASSPPAWLKPLLKPDAPAGGDGASSGSGDGTGEDEHGRSNEMVIDPENKTATLPGNQGADDPANPRPGNEFDAQAIANMADSPEMWEKHKATIMGGLTSADL